MDDAGSMAPQAGVELPWPTEPPTEPPAPPPVPAQAIDTGARTPLIDTPRNLPATYRSAATRATVAMVLVGIAVAAFAVQALAQLSQLGILDAAVAGTLTDAEAAASDARVASLGVAATGTYLVSGIAVLVWLYRAVGNIPILTTRAGRWSRNEAVGWWFAPVANWVMPYRVVRDSFHDLGAGASATIATAWWACHVGSSVTSWLIRAGSQSAMDSLESIRSYVLITSVTLGVQVAAGILLIVVIRRLEGFARAWERGQLRPETASQAWGQPAIGTDAGPLNSEAPATWPDVAGALAAAEAANADVPAVAVRQDAPFVDPRTIESVVASPDGPMAPPPPAPA